MSWQLTPPDENRATMMSHENGVYTFHVRLAHPGIPTISRLICVPASPTFDCFHLILQTAIGWSNKHCYSFTVSEPRPPSQVTHATPPQAYLPIPRLPAADRAVLLYHYDFSFGAAWSPEVIFLGRNGSEQHDAAKKALGRGAVEGQAAWCVSVAEEVEHKGHACAEDCSGPDAWRTLKEAFTQKPYFNLGDGSGTSPFDLRLWFAAECSNAASEAVPEPWEWDITKVSQQLAGLTALSESLPDADG
ncbi:Plasmid pRiA4b ORF-3-like protein [Macrophomina phaseolina MS6]|uniref:Plasmid pRiA4b ORF-3-like protein n=1 Tax=Macrophomina phaseolina (strain MS6) TaxID=1126212 RepID=K2R8T7_MACPH|nr:Plasmid pRiA4b ORF-3-like protein [Macrophomina phaseolina MS6]